MSTPLQRLYDGWIAGLELLQSPFLLLVRLYWGWQIFISGKGKLMDLDKVSGFFAHIDIPFPYLNAVLAGCTETFGGLLLLVGFASRLVPVPLLFTMAIAYATTEKEALAVIWSDPDKFVTAAPFLFAFAFLIILLFGPGKFSIDAWLAKRKGHTS